MVGFGSAFRLSRRKGWESAYLDYDNLKLLLTQIEAVYEEALVGANNGSLRQNNLQEGGYVTGLGGFGYDDGDTYYDATFSQDFDSQQAADKNTKSSFRDELFAESDSSAAFASSCGSSQCDDDHEQQRDYHDGLLNLKKYNEFLDNGTSTGNHAEGMLQPNNTNFVGENTFMLGNSSTTPTNCYDSVEYQQYINHNQHQQQQPQDGWIRFGRSINLNDTEHNRTNRKSRHRHRRYPHNTNNNRSSNNNNNNNRTTSNETYAQRKNQRRCRRKGTWNKKKRRRAHIHNANAKARAITGRFLGLLRAEVDKIMLFANSRMGELADTIGSLRFPSDYHPERYDCAAVHSRDCGFDELGYRDDVGMHSSASSSSDDLMVRPSDDWSTSEEKEMNDRHRKKKGTMRRLRRQQQQQHNRQPDKSEDINKVSNGSNINNRSLKKKHRRNKSKESAMEKRKSTLTARQMQHNEQLRMSRPMFQRSDQVVGEDFLLLSAVDEADAYAAVGIELMHLLKFLCVNVIAVRKISKKHDTLLRCRMLGGYYHRHFGENHDIQLNSGDTSIFGSGLDPATGIDQLVLPELNRGRLVGLYDAMIQNLANSSSSLIISESLLLTLSEFDDSRQRADALSGLYGYDGVILTAPSNGSMKSMEDMKDPSNYREGDANASTIGAANSNDSGSGLGFVPSTSSSISLTRLRFVIASILGLRNVARRKYDPLNDYLSRSIVACLATRGDTDNETTPIGGTYIGEAQGMEGCSRETLDFFVDYNPDAAFFLDPHILRKCLVLADQNAIAASCLAVAADLVPLTCDEEDGSSNLYDGYNLDSMNVVLGSVGKRSTKDASKQDFVRLNFFSAALSTMNYYIIFPSAASFCRSLGLKSAYSPMLIGISNIASFIIVIWHAHIVSKTRAKDALSLHHNFRIWLLLGAFFGLIGNILYSLAYIINFPSIAFLGRLILGLSSSEMINKYVISVTIPIDRVVKEIAALRKTNMIAMILGAVCGTVFEFMDYNITAFSKTSYASIVNFKTIPGYFMALLWILQTIGLLNSKEVNRPSSYCPSSDEEKDGKNDDNEDDDALCNKSPAASFSRSHYGTEISSLRSLHALLLIGDISEKSAAESVDSRNDNPESLAQKRKKRSIPSTLKRIQKLVFLNNSLPVTLVSLLMCTITIEIIFSSCAIITHRYFRWSSSSAGLIIVIMTCLIYPIYRVAAYWSRCHDERVVMKKSLSGILFGIIIFVNYGELIKLFFEARNLLTYSEYTTKYDWRFGRMQYCVGAIAIFICCIALESVTLSLLTKVSPPRLNVSTFNCSLLVPLLICLGRFLGDAILLSVGISHRIINTDVVNSLSFIVLCLCCPCLYLIKKFFFFLHGS